MKIARQITRMINKAANKPMAGKIFTAVLLATTALSTPTLAADIEAASTQRISIAGNVGATTDYIWRGNTQTKGDTSLSGGIDVSFENGLANGLAVGTWVGSLGRSDNDDANYEFDLYASYSFGFGGLDYELGYISYMYPGVANSISDFADGYVSVGYGPVSLSYYILASAKDAAVEKQDGTYVSLDAEYPLIEAWTLGLHYGSEEFDTDPSDEDTAVSLSKSTPHGDMTFTVSGDEGDDTRAIISWGQAF